MWKATSERPELFGYAAEKLSAAVQTLATNPFDIKGRLWAAFPDLAAVPRSGLPPNLREKYEAILRDLSANPKGVPEFGASFHRRHLKTLAPIAQRIYSLQAEVDHLQRRQRER